MLRMLIGKLELVTSSLNGLVRTEVCGTGAASQVKMVARPLKYALKKQSVDEAIEALESWQRVADPSWFLLLRIADAQVDSALDRPGSHVASSIPSAPAVRACVHEETRTTGAPTGLSLPSATLREMDISPTRFSSVRIAQSIRSDKVHMYILNTVRPADPGLYDSTKRDVRDLAKKLQHTEPEAFGLLSCKGFVTERSDDVGTKTGLAMVFRVPRGLSHPRSLREHILSTPCPRSLSHRFDIARDLAKSVNYVHLFGFVHKNIRPETVLALDSDDASTTSTFLMGFDEFRKEEGRTRRLGDDGVETNLYRHPSRQGASPECEYAMQHDIYSLGVCMLEVGLWQSFVVYDEDDMKPMLSPALFGSPAGQSPETVHNYLRDSVKGRFISLAQSQLPACMGTRYASIVETCLTCLDPDNTDFGRQEEFEDEDGIRVGVRYIEKVTKRRVCPLCVLRRLLTMRRSSSNSALFACDITALRHLAGWKGTQILVIFVQMLASY